MAYSQLIKKLFEPIDGASIAVFRIGFGLILCADIIRYGWIFCLECNYAEPDFLFKYYGFEWVQPWPLVWLQWHHAALAVCALGISFGLYYRACILLFTLGFSYLFLLDQAQYLNHFYMVILFCILLCFVPAHRTWSLDAIRKPELASNFLPFWGKLLLVGQLEIILIYAGIAKLNWDWLNLEPLKMWLETQEDMPFFGEYFIQDWSVALATYGVIALHLVGAPLLFVKGVRWVVLGIYASFHVLNHFVFNIGIFPWMTLFASMLCFEPDWPRRLYRFLRRFKAKMLSLQTTPYQWPTVAPTSTASIVITNRHKFVALLVISWLLLQCLIPLRHHLYAGNVAWNEEGHRFSWRMKLRSKSGWAMFTITDQNTGRYWRVGNGDYLTHRQFRKMPCLPDLILQYAHFLETLWKTDEGLTNIAVNAQVKCSLNGRSLQTFVDPDVDLTTVRRSLAHREWILPLETPLPKYFLPRAWFTSAP